MVALTGGELPRTLPLDSIRDPVSKTTSLDRFTVPLGGQQIELQEIVHVEGGMPMLRIRIREGRRFTVFDIDRDTAARWAETMRGWSERQKG